MKLDDPTAGKITSDEHQYDDKNEWQAAIDTFLEQQPQAKRYSIQDGYSFFGDIEHRFVCVKGAIPFIKYYTMGESNSDALDSLIKLYDDYTSPDGGDYLKVTYPHKEGLDAADLPSARCIMANAKTSAPVGLIINPPFPNGHPNKRRLKRRAEKYLLLLAGISLGLTLGPALKILTTFLRKKR